MDSFQELVQSIDWDSLTHALLRVLGVFLCLTVHETCHGLAAYALGDPTAKRERRLSLNPLHHIDWFGLAAMLLVGFGWAKPVVVNSSRLKHFRRDDVLISLAGPFMNLLLAFVFTGVWYFVRIDGEWYSLLMSYLIGLNLIFAVFNVLPVPPLDGFHVVTSLFVRKHYGVVEFLQKYGYILLVVLVFSNVLDTLLGWATTGLYSLFLRFYGLFA